MFFATAEKWRTHPQIWKPLEATGLIKRNTPSGDLTLLGFHEMHKADMVFSWTFLFAMELRFT